MHTRPFGDHVVRCSIMAVSLVALGGCSVLTPAPASLTASPAQSPAQSTPQSPAAARAPKGAVPKSAPKRAPSDANIAAMLVAGNDVETAYSEQALAKSRDADIRKFATMTRMDHESMSRTVGALATKLKLKPSDDEAALILRDDAAERRGRFRDLEGFAYDSAYIHNEVASHTLLLAVIDESLAPAAKSAELRQLLAEVRPAIAAHMQHAEILAAKKARRR